ncbi:fimbrial protein [Lelliottia sp. SL45]|uniref:fimbrial protein n=1 Tax=Lelliottia sp. SL45 TaxID=2994665 RepID=UPI0022751ABF|nr:fimbrial protein [Lelliottia sp. SL45]MCY1700987.1 fimbrial protein [Lelliottia sp. SL45]
MIKNALSTLMYCGLACSFVSGASHAAGSGSGTVTFTGTIIEAPCSIAQESADQTVNLGQVALEVLKQDDNQGFSTPVRFSIKLIDCSVVEEKASVVFRGVTSPTPNGLLTTTGSANFVYIGLRDSDGTRLPIGAYSNRVTLVNGSNTLDFSAFVQGNGSDEPTPGDFTGTAIFEMEYF